MADGEGAMDLNRRLGSSRLKSVIQLHAQKGGPGHGGVINNDDASVSIPVLGLGVFLMSPKEAFDSVLFGLQHGYRHVDTAHLYGNEQSVGISSSYSESEMLIYFVFSSVILKDFLYCL